MKDDIVAESLELVAHAAALAVLRTREGICGHAGFRIRRILPGGCVLDPAVLVVPDFVDAVRDRHYFPRHQCVAGPHPAIRTPCSRVPVPFAISARCLIINVVARLGSISSSFFMPQPCSHDNRSTTKTRAPKQKKRTTGQCAEKKRLIWTLLARGAKGAAARK